MRGLAEVCRAFVRCVVDNPEDDVMGALGSTMASKAAGKDIAHEAEGRRVTGRGRRREGLGGEEGGVGLGQRCASKAAAEGMRGDTVWVQSGCEQRHWTSRFLLSATTPQSTFYCCAPPPLHTQPWAPLSLAPKLSSAIRHSTACSPSSRGSRRSQRLSTLLSLSTPTTTVSQIMRGRGQSVWKLL